MPGDTQPPPPLPVDDSDSDGGGGVDGGGADGAANPNAQLGGSGSISRVDLRPRWVAGGAARGGVRRCVRQHEVFFFGLQPRFFASVLRSPSSGVDPKKGASSPSRVSGLRSALIVAVAATASAPAAAEAAAARVTRAATSTMASGPSSKSLAPRAVRCAVPAVRRDAPLQSALASQTRDRRAHKYILLYSSTLVVVQ